MSQYVYAGYPSAKVYEKKAGSKQIQHLLWGDWVRLEGEEEDGWVPIHTRGVDGWMKSDELQSERLLEIVFVDVGQGDGCLLITPRDEHHVIDAGIGENMYRFLRWRYGGFKKKWRFKSAVLTHPDSDHYAGFRPLFEDENVYFGKKPGAKKFDKGKTKNGHSVILSTSPSRVTTAVLISATLSSRRPMLPPPWFRAATRNPTPTRARTRWERSDSRDAVGVR